jgi:hypothetical protein
MLQGTAQRLSRNLEGRRKRNEVFKCIKSVSIAEEFRYGYDLCISGFQRVIYSY